MRLLKHYRKNEQGVATIEFVAVSLALFAMVFFVIEMTSVFFFIMSAQKAAHMGARLAIVSTPAATGLPARNGLASGGINGTPCNDASSPCTGFSTVICEGGAAGCNTVAFNRILGRMQDFLAGLEAEHVTIAYSDQGLGFAGGPTIPAVTVRIHDYPYQTGIMGFLMGSIGFDTLPAVSVTLTGEDLNTGGAS